MSSNRINSSLSPSSSVNPSPLPPKRRMNVFADPERRNGTENFLPLRKEDTMTTEYYQIPSQQGLLPLTSSAPDPWLTSSFSSLSLSEWTTPIKSNISPPLHPNPPSLFEPGDAESLAWKHVVPMHAPSSPSLTKVEIVRALKTPKNFISTSSKIDAWSMVENGNNVVVVKQAKKQSKIPQQPTPLPTPILTPTLVPTSPEDKPIEDELTTQNRYKTELCKSFNETGICRYGVKCQFAHGKEEIRPILRHPKYKTEICKTFHTTGTCPYGIRCRFIHTKSKEEAMMNGLNGIMKNHMNNMNSSRLSLLPPHLHVEEEEDADDDDSVNAPPGIPVPQWSKSWTMSMATAMPSKNILISDGLAEPEPAF